MNRWFLFLFSFIAACGGSVSDRVCSRLEKCGINQSPIGIDIGAFVEYDCQRVFAVAVFSQDCIDAIMDASCDEHRKGNPSYSFCWPPCIESWLGFETKCIDEDLHACQENSRIVLDCAVFCEEMLNAKSLGMCSSTCPNLEPTDEPQCCCDFSSQ